MAQSEGGTEPGGGLTSVSATAIPDPTAAHPLGSDPRDLAGLYVQHRHGLAVLAHRYLHNPYDVDEVVQEAFLRLGLSMPELGTPEQALAYARRTVVNLCLDRIRRDRRAPAPTPLDTMLLEPVSPDAAPEDPILAAEDAVIVRAALAKLAPTQRRALIAWEVEERTTAEIADELGIEETAVKHVLHRARRALRKLLVGSSVDPSVDLLELPASQVWGIAGQRAVAAGGKTALALLLIALPGLAILYGYGQDAGGVGVADPPVSAPGLLGTSNGLPTADVPGPTVTSTNPDPSSTSVPSAASPGVTVPGEAGPGVSVPGVPVPVVPAPGVIPPEVAAPSANPGNESTPTPATRGSSAPSTGSTAPGQPSAAPGLAPAPRPSGAAPVVPNPSTPAQPSAGPTTPSGSPAPSATPTAKPALPPPTTKPTLPGPTVKPTPPVPAKRNVVTGRVPTGFALGGTLISSNAGTLVLGADVPAAGARANSSTLQVFAATSVGTAYLDVDVTAGSTLDVSMTPSLPVQGRLVQYTPTVLWQRKAYVDDRFNLLIEAELQLDAAGVVTGPADGSGLATPPTRIRVSLVLPPTLDRLSAASITLVGGQK